MCCLPAKNRSQLKFHHEHYCHPIKCYNFQYISFPVAVRWCLLSLHCITLIRQGPVGRSEVRRFVLTWLDGIICGCVAMPAYDTIGVCTVINIEWNWIDGLLQLCTARSFAIGRLFSASTFALACCLARLTRFFLWHCASFCRWCHCSSVDWTSFSYSVFVHF